MVGVLRGQARRVEVQVPSVDIRADPRPPVGAAATHIVHITAIVVVPPYAEEGENKKRPLKASSHYIIAHMVKFVNSFYGLPLDFLVFMRYNNLYY